LSSHRPYIDPRVIFILYVDVAATYFNWRDYIALPLQYNPLGGSQSPGQVKTATDSTEGGRGACGGLLCCGTPSVTFSYEYADVCGSEAPTGANTTVTFTVVYGVDSQTNK